MWNTYYFSFTEDDERKSCVVEASSTYEAISTFWEEHPIAKNVELNGGGINNAYGEIKS